MITDNKKWHYLAVKKIVCFLMLSFVTSKHDGGFYCLNCLHSFRKKNKLKEYENVCKNHDYCNIKMPKEDKSI